MSEVFHWFSSLAPIGQVLVGLFIVWVIWLTFNFILRLFKRPPLDPQ